jgi:hypothetical protein
MSSDVWVLKSSEFLQLWKKQMQFFQAITTDHVFLLTLQQWPQSLLEQLL